MHYTGYKIISENKPGESQGTIWWDGKHTRASSDAILLMLKRIMIPFSTDPAKGTMLRFGAGKEFFNQLPMAYRSGYTHLESIKVNENGEEV